MPKGHVLKPKAESGPQGYTLAYAARRSVPQRLSRLAARRTAVWPPELPELQRARHRRSNMRLKTELPDPLHVIYAHATTRESPDGPE